MNYGIFAIVLTIICVVLFIGVVAFSIYKFITEKESSGEYAGKSSGRSFYQTAIFHSAFTLICFMNIATNNVFMQLFGDVAIAFTTFTFVICASIYFVFLGALRHTFKIDKNNLILFVSSASFNLASIIFFYVVKFAMV